MWFQGGARAERRGAGEGAETRPEMGRRGLAPGGPHGRGRQSAPARFGGFSR
jgi:hypothetical protein